MFLLKLINRFRRDEEGAALVEYGMLVGLIAVICVVAVTLLGKEVSNAFSMIAATWPISETYGNRRLVERGMAAFDSASPVPLGMVIGVLPLFRETSECSRSANASRRDEKGAALVEYALLVALIAVICVAGVTLFGQEVSTAFSRYAVTLSVI